MHVSIKPAMTAETINKTIEHALAGDTFDVDLAELCHSIGRLKGFWHDTLVLYNMGGKIGDLAMQAHIWKQFHHLLNEYVLEFQPLASGVFTGVSVETMYEELADVFIVMCDLAYIHGTSLYAAWMLDIPDMVFEGIEKRVNDMTDQFRKKGFVNPNSFLPLAWEIFEALGGDPTRPILLSAILKKCQKNMNRPQRYGIAPTA